MQGLGQILSLLGKILVIEYDYQIYKEVLLMEKKLYKINKGKKVCGVCLGLAEYLKMDVSVIRIVVVLLSLFGSFGFWAYVICALILPWKPEEIQEVNEVIDAEN